MHFTLRVFSRQLINSAAYFNPVTGIQKAYSGACTVAAIPFEVREIHESETVFSQMLRLLQLHRIIDKNTTFGALVSFHIKNKIHLYFRLSNKNNRFT